MTAIEVAELLVAGAEAYLVLGAVFAVPFALFLAQRLDPAVPGSTWGFRLMILPGAALLWPVLLWRVLGRRTKPEECNAHRAAAADVAADRLVRTERTP